MTEIINAIINISGPLLVGLVMFMAYYLLLNKAVTFSHFMVLVFWPEIIFRFRDFTKMKKGNVNPVYYLFCLNLLILSVGIALELLGEIKDIPAFALAIVGLIACLFFSMIFLIFFNLSKEKYY